MASYYDNNGDKCGRWWPSSGNLWGGVGRRGSNRTCDGKARDYTTIWPPMGSGVNGCGVHRGLGTGGISSFASPGKKIEASDVNGLLDAIKDELRLGSRTTWRGAPRSVGSVVNVADFQGMANAMENDIGFRIDFGNDIEASKVNQLINEYNKLTRQCICHSDCGANQRCICHNDCGCHY